MKHFLISLIFFCLSLSVMASAAPTEVAMPVEAVQVEQGPWEEITYLIASVNPISAVQITAEVGGRVKSIHFQEGETVSQGQLLIGLDDVMAKATLDQAAARLALSKEHFERKKVLQTKGSITKSELDEALANLRVDEASVELAQASLEKTKLIAPFSGKLGLKQITIGQYITPGKPLVSLEATETLQVDFTLPEAYLASLNQQLEVSLVVPSLPKTVLKARIVATEPSLEIHSRGLRVRAHLKSQGLLKPGQFAEVAYVFFREENVFSLPETAIVPNLNGAMAYKITDNRIEIKPIKIGRRHGGLVQIIEGLSAQDQVVLSGQMKLQPGALVQVVN